MALKNKKMGVLAGTLEDVEIEMGVQAGRVW